MRDRDGSHMRTYNSRQLPRNLTSLYHSYTYEAAETGPAFMYDDVAAWRKLADELASIIAPIISTLASADSGLAAQEHEFLTKGMVCWRDRGYGTLHVPDPAELSCRNRAQADALRPFVKERAKAYVAHVLRMDARDLRNLHDTATVVIGKGKGAPYWNPSSDKAAAIALSTLSQNVSNVQELYDSIAAAGSATTPFLQTSYIRIQGSRKRVPNYVIADGEVRQVGDRRGPKVRRIGAQPFATNHLWAPAGTILRHLMATMDERNTGTLEPVIRAATSGRWPVIVAYDLSGYDTTVALETLDMLREDGLVPILHALVAREILQSRVAELLLDIDRMNQRMPILLPPRNMSEAAWLATAEGQTRSGVNLTSWIGTELNRARIDAKASALGISKSDYLAFNYGDDTIIMFKTNHQAALWAEGTDMFGFIETVAPDRTYLMRRVPEGYNYMSRMLFSTLNREVHQEPQNCVAGASAIAIRNSLLTGHPLHATYMTALGKVVDYSPERFKSALLMAQGATDAAVTLPIIAAKMKLQQRPGVGLQDETQLLARLADGGTVDVAGTVQYLEDLMYATRFQMTWADLQAATASMGVQRARVLLRQRSYTQV